MNELLSQPVRNVIECIESWHNEDYTQWYRIYSDKLIEQGGYVNFASSGTNPTITMPRKIEHIISANFTFTHNVSNTSGNVADRYIKSVTSTSITINSYNTTGGGFWIVRGYI